MLRCEAARSRRRKDDMVVAIFMERYLVFEVLSNFKLYHRLMAAV